MDKLSAPFRYMLTGFSTAGVFGVIAYFVLRPLEWRPQLLGLLAHAFVSFTQYLGTNGPGWIISVVGSSVFTIIATIVLVGFVRGSVAMRQHWIETAAIALLALIGQIVLLYGPIYLRTVTRTVYDDHQAWVAKASAPKPPCPACYSCPTCTPCKACPPALGFGAEENLKITTKTYGGFRTGNGDWVFFVAGSTNRTIGPVNARMTCDRDFIKLGPAIFINRGDPPGTFEGARQSQPDNRTFEYSASSPAWTPDSPLGFPIVTKSSDGIRCNIVQR